MAAGHGWAATAAGPSKLGQWHDAWQGGQGRAWSCTIHISGRTSTHEGREPSHTLTGFGHHALAPALGVIIKADTKGMHAHQTCENQTSPDYT